MFKFTQLDRHARGETSAHASAVSQAPELYVAPNRSVLLCTLLAWGHVGSDHRLARWTRNAMRARKDTICVPGRSHRHTAAALCEAASR